MSLVHDSLPFTPHGLSRAKTSLQQAQASYTQALNDLIDAKSSLEFRRAELIAEGVKGKNADERDASVRLSLFDQYAHLAGCEAALNEARRDLEVARVEWDCLRYKLRLFEATRLQVAA